MFHTTVFTKLSNMEWNTHTAVIAGSAKGLSSREEPNCIDITLVVLKLHHASSTPRIPDERSSVTALGRGRRSFSATATYRSFVRGLLPLIPYH